MGQTKIFDAPESGGFDAEANALERRIFKRRVQNPTVMLQRLRSELRATGLTRIAISWMGADANFSAQMGRRLFVLVSQANQIPPGEILYSAVVRAARRANFQVGIEDVGVWMEGQTVRGVVRGAPFQEMTTALDRLWEVGRGSEEQKHRRRRHR